MEPQNKASEKLLSIQSSVRGQRESFWETHKSEQLAHHLPSSVTEHCIMVILCFEAIKTSSLHFSFYSCYSGGLSSSPVSLSGVDNSALTVAPVESAAGPIAHNPAAKRSAKALLRTHEAAAPYVPSFHTMSVSAGAR
ncbi:unnamed protein product [Pleuronectes platessa]|uniref:Uncharacterized protein n=1 Tax=Pleuronectes platessa TaxID=8262 RepID=A0A9N7Z129_PLEPL|nr:unnamed protein product [Pleuronectes platessa]